MKPKILGRTITASAAVMIALALFIAASHTARSGGAAEPAATAPSVKASPIEKGGAQLWGERCQFCHNARSPSTYNDAQWEVVMLHMRIRANLTPEEQKKILAFLKSGQ